MNYNPEEEEELDRLQKMRDYYNENPELDPPEGLFLSAAQIEKELQLERDMQLAFSPASIAQTTENSPGVTSKKPDYKFLLCLKDGANTLWYDGKGFTDLRWEAKTYNSRGVGSAKFQLQWHPYVKRLGPLQVVENSPPQSETIHYQADAYEQLSIFGAQVECVDEPPDPDDFPDLEAFKAAYLDWISNQLDDVQAEHQHIDAEEVWNQSGVGIGLTYAAELVPVSHTRELNNGDAIPTPSLNGTNSAAMPSLEKDSPAVEDLAASKPWTLGEATLASPSTSSPQVLPVNPSVLDSSELNILLLPDLQNLGSFNKNELLSIAKEQHEFILNIERQEFNLAVEKLHRVRATGICLQEFKRRCKYGEFENELKAAGISVRSSQNYMTIAKNWDIVEAKTKLVSLLAEESPTIGLIGLKWALEAIRDEKKALKSAAPPTDPDSWRTPNTRDQPIVQLVTEALGGEIWCDPCADAGHRIPARVHYNTSNSGLNARNLWTKTVFINPPFSDPLPWVDKCCRSIARGDCSQAIMLLKAGTLSNQGTGELIKKYASGICHWRGRINFLNDHGIAVKGSDFDCVLIYFGDKFDRFQETFETFGTVCFIENHYSSVNKHPIPSAKSVAEESKKLTAAVGLSNGKSVLPDLRDSDRELMERCDPHTVDDRPFATATVEMTRSESMAMDRFEEAKQNCLKDYITAINGNLPDFSDEQIAFLAKIINEESAKRICAF